MDYSWLWIGTFVGVIFILVILGVMTHKKWRYIVALWWKRKLVGKFISTVLLPVLIPFGVSVVLAAKEPFSWEETKDKFIIVVLAGSCLIMVVNSVVQFLHWKKERNEAYLRWENRASSYAYNNLYKIHKDKNIQFKKKSHEGFKNGMLEDKQIPYDIFSHVQKICSEFSDTIAAISSIPSVRISVSFIYRYTYQKAKEGDQEWRWIMGRNSKFNRELQDFVDKKGSIYYHMVHNEAPFVFYNNKKDAEAEGIYYYSSKDRLYSESGSLFASKFAFNNNEENCCEGIIMVTSYGEKFVKNNVEYTEKEFEQLLLDKIFPCYKNLLQVELGMLYFRHHSEKGKSSSHVSCRFKRNA